jgi:putative transposase
MLQTRLGLSERRACRAVGQARSSQRYQPADPDPDSELRAWLREFSAKRPRWGYRRAHVEAAKAGHACNIKKIHRLWREEGLRVPQKRRKRRRLGETSIPAERRTATAPDQVWALDFQFDVTAAGRTIKLPGIIDEFTRESLAIVVDRSIDADATVTTLEKAVIDRGRAPEFIRCENGPELTAHALVDWCTTAGTGTHYIDPGSPGQNAWTRSFNSKLRDECLAVEQFHSLLKAQIVIAEWRRDYNDIRPRSALGMLTPTEFAARQPQPTLS